MNRIEKLSRFLESSQLLGAIVVISVLTLYFWSAGSMLAKSTNCSVGETPDLTLYRTCYYPAIVLQDHWPWYKEFCHDEYLKRRIRVCLY